MAKPHTFVVHNQWALGDTVCLSALARDLHRAYPGKYELLVGGHYKNVFWDNNPYCKKAPDNPPGQLVRVEYRDGIIQANHGLRVHFLSWFHRSFEALTGLAVPVTEPKGDIHLAPAELARRPAGRYWVVVAGGKTDMTAKVWSAVYWQQTVDELARRGVRCVQTVGDFTRHFHPTLANVERWEGKAGSERGFCSVIAGAEGVICGITAAMHIAAVYDKPCVVIAGGREPPWWEAYTNCYYPTAFGPKCSPVKVEHTFLHTVGLLDCGVGNKDRGCWKDRAVPLDQADLTSAERKQRLCRKPAEVGHQMVPECLKLITPSHVVEAVMTYYGRGILPPLQRGSGETVRSLPTVTKA